MERLLLKPSEVVELLGIGRSKLYELVSEGQIPHVRIGRCIRIPSQSIEPWISAQLKGEAFMPAPNAEGVKQGQSHD